VTSKPVLDDHSFLELIKTHGPSLLKCAESMLGDKEEARACLQECYTVARRAILDFNSPEDFYKQIHDLLVECCLRKMKMKVAAEKDLIDGFLPQFDSDGCRIEPDWNSIPTAHNIISHPNAKQHIMGVLDELPPVYRYVFYLRDVEGFTTKQIAEKLDLTEKVAKTILHSTRAILKKRLEPIMLELELENNT